MDITRGTADLVARAIEQAGQTNLAVAEKCGIPRTTLLRRLSGASPFTVSELERIADLLDMQVHSLIPTTDTEAVA